MKKEYSNSSSGPGKTGSSLRSLIAALVALFVLTSAAAGAVRIKDMISLKNDRSVELIGYGLIIGLDGTGDGKNASFTTQSLVNMIERMGLTVDPNTIKVRNVASVIVTARLDGHSRQGAEIDVTVSSIGDATSLQGGTLLMTPLADLSGVTHAIAQGPVSIGGFNISVDDGNRIVNNYTLVGRVPNGGRVTEPLAGQMTDIGMADELTFELRSPDYTTCERVAHKINLVYGRMAYPLDDGNIRVVLPDSLKSPNARIQFVSRVGQLRINPDVAARVVINEKTGTIVAGEHVSIAPVAIAHGTITVNIRATPVISQPEPFSQGETVLTSESSIQVDDENARVMYMDEAISISDVAQALNTIGATPRDIIAIFQALKQVGALRADLVIL